MLPRLSVIFLLSLILVASLSACASAPVAAPSPAQASPSASSGRQALASSEVAAAAAKATPKPTLATQVNPQLLHALRQPVSLDFLDAPFKTVLQAIAVAGGLEFSYDTQIPADLRLTLFAKQTTTGEALKFLLQSQQLDYTSQGGKKILIYPDTPQKQAEHQTLLVRNFYLANGDVKALANTLKTVLKLRDITMDERLGMLSIRDTAQALRLTEQVIALQDVADPELELEIEIFEVKRHRLLELGLDWPDQFTLSPLEPGKLTLKYLQQLRSAQVSLGLASTDLRAYAENQDVQILAQPKIRVRSKERAKLQIGDRIPLVTANSTATGLLGETVNYIDVGIKLDAVPVLNHHSQVVIDLNLEVSSLVREITGKNGTRAFQIGTRALTTLLQLQDGESAILAGLISEEERQNASRLPVLGELPLASRLFGSQLDNSQRGEILLVITPRVIRAFPVLGDTELYSGTQSKPGVRDPALIN